VKRFKNLSVGEVAKITVGDLMKLSEYYASMEIDRSSAIRLGEDILKRPISEWAGDDGLLQLQQALSRNLSNPVARAAVADSLKALNHDVPPGAPDALYELKNPKAADSFAFRMAKRYAEAASRESRRLGNDVGATRADVNALRAELKRWVDARAKESLARFANERRERAVALKEAERRALEQEIDTGVSAARAAVATLRAFGPKDRDFQAVAAVLNAEIEVAGFAQKMVAGIVSGPGVYLGVYGIVFNMAQTLISILGNSGPSEFQQVMEQIQELRSQVRQLHLEMRDRFRGLEGQLDRVESLIDDRFDHIERVMRGEFDNTRERLRHSEEVGNRILQAISEADDHARRNARSQEARKTENVVTTLECRGLDDVLSRGVSLTPEQIERYLPWPEFAAGMDYLYNSATKFSRDPLGTGYELNLGNATGADKPLESRHRMNWKLAQKLSVYAPQHELRAQLDALQLLDIPVSLAAPVAAVELDNRLPVANPFDWAIHARYFLEAAERWSGGKYPDYYFKYDPSLTKLGEIIDVGRQTRDALRSIVPVDARGRYSALPLLKLAENYEAEIRRLLAEVEARKQALKAQGCVVKGYDPFTPVDAIRVRPGAVTFSQVFPRGVIGPSADYNPKDEKGRAKDKPELAVSRDKFDRYLALIPNEYLLARDLLGGQIVLAYEKCGSFPAEGKDFDYAGFVIDAAFEHDAFGRFPIFKKQVVADDAIFRQDAGKADERATEFWYANGHPIEEKLLAGKTKELLEQKISHLSSQLVRLRIQEFLGAEVRRFNNEEISKDARDAVGKLGDSLHAIEGARLLLANILEMALGAGLEDDAELLWKLRSIKGENLIALEMAGSPQRFSEPALQARTAAELIGPARELMGELLAQRKGREQASRDPLLDGVLDRLESFYLSACGHNRQAALPVSMKPARPGAGARRTPSADLDDFAYWLMFDQAGPHCTATSAIGVIRRYIAREDPSDDRWREILTKEYPDRLRLAGTVSARLQAAQKAKAEAYGSVVQGLKTLTLTDAQYRALSLTKGTVIFDVAPLPYLKPAADPTFITVATKDELTKLLVLPDFLPPNEPDLSKAGTYGNVAYAFDTAGFSQKVAERKAAYESELSRVRFSRNGRPFGIPEYTHPYTMGSINDEVAFLNKYRPTIEEYERFGGNSIAKTFRAREQSMNAFLASIRANYGADNALK
jgi:hypothetical protein